MKIILARHGETDENVARRYLGHTDVPLNENGRSQIHRLALRLQQTQKITRMYCSDLARTRESAEIVGSYLQVKPTSTTALRELHFGEWECETYESILQRDLLQKWIENPFFIAPPNGETLHQLGQRVGTWLSSVLLCGEEDESVLIISHGGPIRWMLTKWLMGEMNEFWNVESVTHGGAIVLNLNYDGCRVIDRLTWN